MSCRSPTGVFFDESSVDALCEAVAVYQRRATAFDPVAIRQHALHFDRPEFKTQIITFLADKMGKAIACQCQPQPHQVSDVSPTTALLSDCTPGHRLCAHCLGLVLC